MSILSPVNLLLTALLGVNFSFAQPVNDACGNAIPLCPNTSVSGTNLNATATVCPDCEDDFTFCFSGTNSTWFTFTTNTTGGDVSISFSAVSFNVQSNRGTELQAQIIEVAVPCNASAFTAIGNCEAGAIGNFILTASALPANTTYYVVVNGAKNNGAALPAEATFEVIATGTGIDRTAAFSSISGPQNLCPGQAVTYSAHVDNCTDTSAFAWQVNGQLVAVTSGNSWQTSGMQNGDVITMECSCFTDCPQSLTSQLGPVSVESLTVNAGPDQMIPSGETALLSGTTNGTSWYWTPGASLANPASLQTAAIPQSTTTYFLTASSSGCTLSDEVVITVAGQFIIPGSFTPNGDGVNDTWLISGIDQYPNTHVTIYSRWGQEIADLVGYSSQKRWDGTNNGKNVDDGTYFYIIDLRDGTNGEPIKGFVMVIR